MLASINMNEPLTEHTVVKVPDIRDFSDKVFIGNDMDMSYRYILSLNPSLNHNGEIYIPSTISAAMEEMYSSSPKWFLRALVSGENEFECSVVVNDVDYSYVFDSWFYINWRLYDADSDLRKEIIGIIADPASEDMLLRSYLTNTFCEYAKKIFYDEK
jgi:hypothetical protein